MRITTTIPIDNSAEEFAAAVATADVDQLLLSMSAHSAELERFHTVMQECAGLLFAA